MQSNTVSKNEIFDKVVSIINRMNDDWEYSNAINENTLLVADLAFESIDIVILGSEVEKEVKQQLPFSNFLMQIGQKEIKDISVQEIVEFVMNNMSTSINN